MIKGVLFDMDGVLVDSEPFICKAAVAMFNELGHKVQESDFLPFVGAGEDRYLGGVAEKYGIKLEIEKAKKRTYEIYEEIIQGNMKPLPGVREFLRKCRNRNLKIALATSADKTKMEANLKSMDLPLSVFDAAVNGLDIERKKPFPDIYLKAARLIGLSPEECLVVEDAVNGIQAGKAAGAKCLAITSSFSREELSGADWFSEDLASAPDEVLNW